MFKKLNIRIKLIIFISLLLLITMIFIGVVFSQKSEKELLKSISEKLHVINDLKIEKVNTHFNKANSCFEQIGKFNKEKKYINHYLANYQSPNDTLRRLAQSQKEVIEERLKALQEAYAFQRVMIITLKGKIAYSTDDITSYRVQDSVNFSPDGRVFSRALQETSYSEIYHLTRTSQRQDGYYMTILRPFQGDSKHVSCILACELSMAPIYKSINDTTGLGKGLGETGETILTKQSGKYVQFVSPPRDSDDDFLSKRFLITSDSAKAASLSISQDHHGWTTEILDYKGDIVDAAYSYIPSLRWGIYTKINHSESFKSIEYLKRIIVSLCSVIIFFSIIIITIFVQRFLTPIMKIRNSIVSLANGRFPRKIEYDNQDEIHDTTNALNNLVERLKRSTDFAQKIGKGDLDAEFKDTENHDVLSRSLVSMRNSLAQIEEDNEKRKWATEGIAMHGEVLRKNAENIKKLGVALISSLVKYVDAQHGGIYTVSHQATDALGQATTEDIYYELAGAYAYDIDNPEKLKFRPGQGLIGQCALEGETIYLKNTPAEFTKITSALGEATAAHVLITPLKVNQDVLGVVELASFREFEDYKIEFIEKLGESIASSILAVKSTEKAKELLYDSQIITKELKEREEELKENQEKMLKEQTKLKKEYNEMKNRLKELEGKRSN